MRVLILGGTTEASAILRAVSGDARFHAILSLAGRTAAPKLPEGEVRIGGFGGADGLAAYLANERIDALIDATHPFAVRIKPNALAAANAACIPHLAVLRPAWPSEGCTEVPTLQRAAAALGETPLRVLLTIGQGELHWFGPPHHYIVRSVDPPPDAPQGALILTARGPFTEADERALLAAHGIQALVTKNSGGAAVAAKLAAARALGVRIVMVARPPLPGGPLVPDAAGALAWLDHQAALRGV